MSKISEGSRGVWTGRQMGKVWEQEGRGGVGRWEKKDEGGRRRGWNEGEGERTREEKKRKGTSLRKEGGRDGLTDVIYGWMDVSPSLMDG